MRISEATDTFNTLLVELSEIFEKKTHDYTHGTDDVFFTLRAGALYLDVPLPLKIAGECQEKINRAGVLLRSKVNPKNESLRDSFIDNAIYSLLALLSLHESD